MSNRCGCEEPACDGVRPRRIRRFVEPALLLLLHDQPTHGYALMEGLTRLGMDTYPVDQSVVYRILRNLEDAEVIKSDWETEDTGGPPRRVYRLTQKGDGHLKAWVEELRATDRILHLFLNMYDHHMKHGGGLFHETDAQFEGDPALWQGAGAQKKGEEEPMKVAVVTDDGNTISKHFGRATHFAVVTLQGMQIAGLELRPNPGRLGLEADAHEPRRGETGALPDCHGYGSKGAAAHQAIAAAVSDCAAVIAGGMSWGARECLAASGIRPIITDIETIEQAVAAYADGTIVDHTEWLH